MILNKLPYDLTVCKVAEVTDINADTDFWFVGKTDQEVSLVCRTEDVPSQTISREDGWKAFRIGGVLDFSLIGVLAKISGILAERKIGIFVVSTYNTDYILVKAYEFERAAQALADNGYEVE